MPYISFCFTSRGPVESFIIYFISNLVHTETNQIPSNMLKQVEGMYQDIIAQNVLLKSQTETIALYTTVILPCLP